jgi:hypothetical protein
LTYGQKLLVMISTPMLMRSPLILLRKTDYVKSIKS